MKLYVCSGRHRCDKDEPFFCLGREPQTEEQIKENTAHNPYDDFWCWVVRGRVRLWSLDDEYDAGRKGPASGRKIFFMGEKP